MMFHNMIPIGCFYDPLLIENQKGPPLIGGTSTCAIAMVHNVLWVHIWAWGYNQGSLSLS